MRFSFEAIEHMVACEAKHPCADVHDLVKRRAGGPYFYEDILHHVFGDDIGLGKMKGERIDEIPVLVKQLPEGGFIALCNAQQQLVILVMGAQSKVPVGQTGDKNREKKLSRNIPASKAWGCSGIAEHPFTGFGIPGVCR